jgi:hypothetical protein
MDLHWRGDGHVISILAQYEPEARSMLMGLLTFLRFSLKDKSNVPRRLEKFFTGTAVERAAGAVWDAEEGCAITPDDRHVEAMFHNDAEYYLSGGDTEKATNGDTVITDQPPPERPDPSALNKTLDGDDLNSVTTMGTKGKQTEEKRKLLQDPRNQERSLTFNQLGTSTVRKGKSPTPSSSSSSGHTAAASATPSMLINGIEKQVGKLDGLEKKIEDLSGLGTQLQQVLAAFTRPGGPLGPLFGPANS